MREGATGLVSERRRSAREHSGMKSPVYVSKEIIVYTFFLNEPRRACYTNLSEAGYVDSHFDVSLNRLDITCLNRGSLR